MGKQAKITKNNTKLSLYPLNFEEAVKDLLDIKSPKIQVAITHHCKEGDKVNGNKD
jgi:hypothetical protein